MLSPAIVARLLRGEPLESGGPANECLRREANRLARSCSCWGGYGLERTRHKDRDDEIARLKSKVGEITMDNELLNAKIAAMEGKRPLAHERSRR